MSSVDITIALPSIFSECLLEDGNYEDKPLDVDVEPDGELKGLLEPWYSPDENEALDVDIKPCEELTGFWSKIVTPINVQKSHENEDDFKISKVKVKSYDEFKEIGRN